MPVAEMCERMSAFELNVEWPLFYQWRDQEQRDAEQDGAGGSPFPATMGGGA